MSSSTLIRWSGLAALVGFALLAVVAVVSFFAFPESVATSVAASSNTWFVLHVLKLIALLLGLLGLVGLYARQAEKAGILGLLAFLMTFIALVPRYAWQWMETFIWPIFAHAAPRLLDHPEQYLATYSASATPLSVSDMISLILLFAGVLLFGVASLRARVLPRWAAVLVLVGAALDLGLGFVVEFPFTGAIAGPGLAWMGYAVWSHKQVAAEAPAPMVESGPSLANR